MPTLRYQTLLIERQEHVVHIILDRSEVRNAFNEMAIAEITRAFGEIGADASVRAIVLAARGSVFCAGADLHWMQEMASYTHTENLADAMQLAEMLRTIYRCPKPVVAKIQGDCYAGGMGLVAACDIAVAAEGVHFCLSEVKLGLIPATISPYVIKSIGENAARRYFLSAERFSAQEAQRIGFVHEMVKAEALDATVDRIVRALISNSPDAVQAAKRLVHEVAGMPLTDALMADSAERIAASRASKQGREGVRAFLEKRKPDWLS